jgi:uncharacterized BrkB/YihY/UPF0761 family membrane protein
MQIKSKNELAVTLFKALSLYSFIEALAIIAGEFPYSTDDYNNTMQLELALYALTALLLVIFGIIIWVWADALARAILKNNDGKETTDVTDIHVIVCSFIGLCILCGLIVDIANIYYWLHTGQTPPKPFLYFAIQLVVGLWFLCESRWIVNFIMKLRRKYTI